MSTLYELTSDYEEVVNMLYDEDIDEQTVFDTLEGIEAEFEDKADGYAKIIKTLNADALAIRAERERLKEREDAIKNRAKNLNKHLENAMRLTGKTKFKTLLFSFGIQKNGGVAPLLIDEKKSLEDIPEEYKRYVPELNKELIREELNSGVILDFAKLGERGESLRIR